MAHDHRAALARQLAARGFCVVEGAHGPEALAHQERLLYGIWERQGKPPLTGFGLGVHPLLTHAPEMAPYYDCPAVDEVLAEVFGDRPRLCHTGARIASEASAANIGWHHHYGWDPLGAVGRKRLERVVVNYYVKGVSPAIGSRRPSSGDKNSTSCGLTRRSTRSRAAMISVLLMIWVCARSSVGTVM